MTSTITEEAADVELGYDPTNAFEVILSNGDRATADSPEAIHLAARTLLVEARQGSYYARATATFLYQGKCVRADVREGSL